MTQDPDQTTSSPSDDAPGDLRVDVWMDVVCPWCYIGKRRVEEAVAASERPMEVTVVLHAYELDPEAPVGGGVSVTENLARKYGTDADGVAAMHARVAAAAQPDGIRMNFEAQVRANSFDAHRLIALGLLQGGPPLQAAVAERLFSAHFAEGLALDDHPTLQRLGAEAGLDELRVSAVLASEELAPEVRADEDLARQLQITGVPFTVAGMGTGRRLAVSGAQSVEVFGELLHTVAHPAPATETPAPQSPEQPTD